MESKCGQMEKNHFQNSILSIRVFVDIVNGADVSKTLRIPGLDDPYQRDKTSC